MPTSRRAGGISKRCECRSPDGKLLGKTCPQLSKKNHGAVQLRQELPLDADGKRRPFRRTGYAKVTDAQADLTKLQAILDLAGDDEDAARRVGDLLQNVMRDRSPIPEAVEVSRRIGVGVPLDGAMTVGEWLDTWVASKKAKVKTTNGYRSHLRVHLKPGLGHYRLDRLNVGHVQEFFDRIDEQNEVVAAENAARREQEARAKWGKNSRPPAAESKRLAAEREKLEAMPPYRLITGPATKQRIRATLRTALNAAIKRQLITFNPAAHVELESGKRPKAMLWADQHVEHWRKTGVKPSPVMVWTPVQIGAFLDAAEESRLYAFFHLIAFRGLRRGEGVGQDWVHVDLDGQAITIAKEIVVDGWVPFEDDPKTDGSAATIGLDSVNVAVLRAHRERQAEDREAWNRHAAEERAKGKDVADWTDTGKVFADEDGTWLHPEKVSDEFRRVCRRADLPPINLRDLRHCAATLIHAGGGDLHAIKETLRHSTIKLASDTYTSLLREVDLEIAEKAAALVPRARKPREETAVAEA
ncbi:site-specific integrase [Streptomyces europaeiscabiei]|uniref:Site-specific integrase n=1 Tax=Streptomyces europaeiscabiei TaxID=146819 RepID=A0ABU4N960_9ACTN|nr:site-specific integrase [Streptomyces europaeiscabiei]MDX3559035.1 site-specific integrase [Streptomyces europaeiscabiei]MDX3699610.1 site-specific integrase [Streptomyces europaeiscabiei]